MNAILDYWYFTRNNAIPNAPILVSGIDKESADVVSSVEVTDVWDDCGMRNIKTLNGMLFRLGVPHQIYADKGLDPHVLCTPKGVVK